jgi:hypothetical protein
MLDFSHVPSSQQNRQIFYAIGGSNFWQTWQKPRGAKMVSIMCIGGGGGGAQGGINTAGATPVPGGGGGGSSSITTGLFPTFLFPDILYIQVGLGGLGAPARTSIGNPSVAAGNGGISYISVAPTSSANSLVLASGTAGAIGASTSAGAIGGTVFTNTSFSSLGIIKSIDGAIGSDSSTTADAASITALSNGLTTGGAAGGGRNNAASYNGGSILPSSTILLSTVVGGLGAAGLNAGGGLNGYGFLFPIFCGTGGSGGGGVLTGYKGGDGGDGFYGCGGGGAGATQNPLITISSKGGRGGDGIVFITTIF